MPLLNHQRLRREYDLRVKDGATGVFFTELRESLRSGEIRPEEFSIRELFENFIESGHEIVRSWRPNDPGSGIMMSKLMEAGHYVSVANFSNIVGQIVYSKVLEQLASPEFLFDKVVTVIPTPFLSEKVPGIGAVGDRVEAIGDGEAYPLVGLSEQYIDTPQTVKRGAILGLTREIVMFDRTGVLMQMAQSLANSVLVNREKRVLDVVCGVVNNHKYNGTAYNTYNASTPWANVATSNALVDWTDIETALLKLDGMTDLATGEPIVVPATSLIVPSALAWTAKRIVNATEIRVGDGASNTTQAIAANPVPSLEVLSNPYVYNRTSSTSTWFAGNPKQAFAYMQNQEPRVDSAPSNSEMEFTHDIVMRWKVSERGVCVPLRPQAMVKSTQ